MAGAKPFWPRALCKTGIFPRLCHYASVMVYFFRHSENNLLKNIKACINKNTICKIHNHCTWYKLLPQSVNRHQRMSTQVLWRPYCFRRFHGNIWNFEPDFNSIVNLCFLKHIHVIMWNTISLLSFKKDTLKHKQMKKPNQKFYLTVLMTLWLHYWNTCRGFFLI